MQLIEFFNTLKVLQCKDYFSLLSTPYNLKDFVTLTGQAVLIPVDQSQASAFFWGILSFLGVPRSNPLSLALLLRLNTEPWPSPVVRLLGWSLYSKIFRLLIERLLFYFVIIKQLSTLQQTQFFMSELNTSRLIAILSVIKFKLAY